MQGLFEFQFMKNIRDAQIPQGKYTYFIGNNKKSVEDSTDSGACLLAISCFSLYPPLDTSLIQQFVQFLFCSV